MDRSPWETSTWVAKTRGSRLQGPLGLHGIPGSCTCIQANTIQLENKYIFKRNFSSFPHSALETKTTPTVMTTLAIKGYAHETSFLWEGCQVEKWPLSNMENKMYKMVSKILSQQAFTKPSMILCVKRTDWYKVVSSVHTQDKLKVNHVNHTR